MERAKPRCREQGAGLRAALKAIRNYQPSSDSGAHARAVGAIIGVIEGRAQALTTRLGYSTEEAKKILDHAMAYFLDDKLMITSRAQIGFFE